MASETQQLLFLRRPHGAPPNLVFASKLRGKVDAKSLKRAFQAVVDRHSILRATFTNAGDDEAGFSW